MAYEGGYTSAVNSASDREARSTTNQHLAQLMAFRAIAMQQDQADRARQMEAQRSAGPLLAAMLQSGVGSPTGGPVAAPFSGAPTGPAPQPPMPGQASVPMAPPMGAPGGFSSMPPAEAGGAAGPSPGAPEAQAAPLPDSWSPSPVASPELGGAEPAPPGMANVDQGLGLPPAMPKIPPQMLSVPLAIAEMKKAGLPPEKMYDTLQAMIPVIEKDNRMAMAQLKAETDAEKLKRLYLETQIHQIRAEIYGEDSASKAARRTASAQNATEKLALDRDKLNARLTGAMPSGRARAAGASGTAGAGQAGGLTDEALDRVAEQYRRTAQLPSMSRDPIERRRIINRAAELDVAEGVSAADRVTSRLDIKAAQQAYAQLTKDLVAIRPFKAMLDTNATIAKDLAEKAIATNSQLSNRPLNWLRQNVGDNPDVAEFLAQARIVQTEAARVLNNPRLVGQLTDTARKEMEEVINGNLPINAFSRVIDRIIADGQNRVAAMQDEETYLKTRLEGKVPGSKGAAPGAGGAKAPPKVGEVRDGYRFKGGEPGAQTNWEKVQ